MIFGTRRSRPLSWLKAGTDHGRRVGRVHGPLQGAEAQALGTGFLLDGELFDARLASLPLFLTCNHVVRSAGDSSQWALRHEDASVVFEGMFDDGSPSLSARFLEVVASSPSDQLNYTLLLLDRWPGAVTEMALAPQAPEAKDPVIVLGYPRGGTLSISIEDNEVVGREGQTLYYRAPTEGGSSGSLVLNQYWEAVAMHQGGARDRGNFGRIMAAIVEHARPLIHLQATEARAAELRAGKTALLRPLPDAGPAPGPGEVDYFSAFISYSHDDSTFALRLYNSLQASGVRAWLDKRQMLPGDDIYERVREGIRGWDKILLCCSRSSLSSWWVDNEIDEAFQKERDLYKARQRKVLALVPLDLDGYLFDEWANGKAQQVKSRLAATFRGWDTDPAVFEETFQGLLKALRADAGAREAPPPSKL
jgi:TIR domain-containing protein/trypsin-like peptidase